jgi:hypothetical protein
MTWDVSVSSSVGIRIKLEQVILCLTAENRAQLMELLDGSAFIDDENETLNESFRELMNEMRDSTAQDLESFTMDFREIAGSLCEEYVCIPFFEVAGIDRFGYGRTGTNGSYTAYNPSEMPSVRDVEDNFHALGLTEFQVAHLISLSEG